jgi:hypothetical protein
LACIAAFVAGALTGVPASQVMLGYAGIVATFTILMLAFLTIFVALRGIGAGFSLSGAEAFIDDRFGSRSSATGTLLPILLMPLLLGAFGTFKQMLPLVRSFDWDDSLAAADRALFFGRQPWELTHALLGWPMVTQLLDKIYTMWVVFLFVSVLGFALIAPRQIRARFFLSFALAWILIGVLAAFWMASAGPCYAGQIGAGAAAEFAPLMERLQSVHQSGYPLQALEWQDQLWVAQVNQDYGFARGISAMPSMHNAISFLYLLALGNAGPFARWASRTFAVLIFVTSVHLGWHYAVDGLTAWAAIALIWWIVGCHLRRSGYEEVAGDARLVEAEQAPDGPVAAPARP